MASPLTILRHAHDQMASSAVAWASLDEPAYALVSYRPMQSQEGVATFESRRLGVRGAQTEGGATAGVAPTTAVAPPRHRITIPRAVSSPSGG